MQGSRSFVASALSLLAIGPVAASAAVPDAERDDALEVAARRWGPVCTEDPVVRFRRMESDTLGIARWQGMWDIPSEKREDCRILLNSAREWDWPRLCTTVVHEYGHLAGREHSEDSDSAMHRQYSRPYRGCTGSAAARRWR
jgi:hypothetical protein